MLLLALVAFSFAASSEVIILIAAVITALGVIWKKAVQPFLAFSRHISDLVERGLIVIEKVEQQWLPLQTQVDQHELRITTLEVTEREHSS